VNGPRSVESVSVARIRVPHPVRIRLGGTGACTVGHISGRSAETVGLFVGEHSTSPASLCGSLFTEGKRPRAGSESVARPALRVPERMNSGYEPSIRRKYAVYLRGTPQVRIRDTSRRPGRGMIFRPSALPEDSLTGVLYEAFRTDRLGRNVRRKAVSYRSGADSRSCGRTAIRILYYRKSGRGKSSYESVPTHGITCERRGPSRGGHPFP